MKPTSVVARCTAGGPPAPPPPPPPLAVSIVMYSSHVAPSRLVWMLHPGGSTAASGTHCLTAEPNTPEPRSQHGVAVTLRDCSTNSNDITSNSKTAAAQVWFSSSYDPSTFTNATLRSGLTHPAPHCFGTYAKDDCTLLTALAWETTGEKTVMLWIPTGDVSKHPQRWTFSGAAGTGKIVAVQGGSSSSELLCLAHMELPAPSAALRLASAAVAVVHGSPLPAGPTTIP